jgi:hypothetical protein
LATTACPGNPDTARWFPEMDRWVDGEIEHQRLAGARTARFRLGTDQLLTAADGKSWISFEDFAVALADEIERPAHIRKRFTVGY